MADNNSFPSPRYFSGLLTRSLSDLDTEISPKSILDGRQMFNLGNNPFGYDRNCTNPTTYMDRKPSTIVEDKFESQGIKLALHLDPIENEEMILFGPKLNIQSPLFPPTDFGIKTRHSQLLTASFTAFGCVKEENDVADGLSLKEMESSEDYTCVITHGPNPKTTHIFDNSVVQS